MCQIRNGISLMVGGGEVGKIVFFPFKSKWRIKSIRFDREGRVGWRSKSSELELKDELNQMNHHIAVPAFWRSPCAF